MAKLGYLYRLEGGDYVPYEVMKREVYTDVDGKEAVKMKVAVYSEDTWATPQELRKLGLYDSIAALVANSLADKAYEEVTKQRMGGMISGDQIRRFSISRAEFEALAVDLFESFSKFILNPTFDEVSKGETGAGESDSDSPEPKK